MGDDPTVQHAHNAVISQLSHLGSSVRSKTHIAAKSRVVLAFSLPGQNTPLTIHGKVLSSGVGPVGSAQPSEEGMNTSEIQFVDPSDANLARLKAWALQALPASSESE